MVNTGPIGPAPMWVPEELDDDDLEWVNEQLRIVDLSPAEREWPQIPLRLDPCISQTIEW